MYVTCCSSCVSFTLLLYDYRINVTFVETDGTEIHTKVPVGTNLLEAALSNDIELEGKLSTCLESMLSLNLNFLGYHLSTCISVFAGACEGSCACSTCHLIVMVRPSLSRIYFLFLVKCRSTLLPDRPNYFKLFKSDSFFQDVDDYNKLPDPSDEENDMLDLAFGLTDT